MIQKTLSLATSEIQTPGRTTFTTSRLLDFFSVKELTAQIGHARSAWPLVLLKELIDNALDACEESNVAPEIAITVDDRGLTVQNNGPGIPPEVVTGILDFAVRVSSREAYVSPCRGAGKRTENRGSDAVCTRWQARESHHIGKRSSSRDHGARGSNPTSSGH